MAKSSFESNGMFFKTGVFAVLAAAGFWLFNKSASTEKEKTDGPVMEQSSSGAIQTPETATLPDFLPASSTGEVVRHTYYTLSYSEEHEQAEWVAYELTRQRLNNNWADRGGLTFKPDPDVRTESATPRDYTGTGYDRGHLCAAADMSFDTLALRETFFMSNISPQDRGFNKGIWREMEELARDWARKYGQVFVVTGPMLSRQGIKQIGFSKVTVPVGFFKAIYAPKPNIAIGFIVPNQISTRPVMEYAFNIDYIEKMTGIDFFPEIINGENEKVEAEIDKAQWPVNESRFDMRVKAWNL
jgi:endonuclease G